MLTGAFIFACGMVFGLVVGAFAALFIGALLPDKPANKKEEADPAGTTTQQFAFFNSPEENKEQ